MSLKDGLVLLMEKSCATWDFKTLQIMGYLPYQLVQVFFSINSTSM